MKEQKKQPELRFEGFTDDWEQVKLNAITKRIAGNDGRMNLPTLTISASEGWLDQRKRFSGNIAGNEQKNYTLLKRDELSYNHGNSKLAKFGVVYALKNYEEALVPRVYHSFKVSSECSVDFIEYLFAAKKPDRELRRLISSGARMDGLLNITYNDFSKINISISSKIEQIKIGEFFRKLDELVTLQQRKLDLLRKLKRGYLQQLFPTRDQYTPRLRFSDFAGNWKRANLGDFGYVAMNKRVFKDQTSEVGEIPFYKIGTFGKKADSFISRELFKEYKAKYPYPKTGDLLISASGSIGKIVEYTGKDEYFQDSNIVWLVHDRRITNAFLKQIYHIIKWSGLEGSTIKRLYNKNILETKICITSLAEQNLISTLLTLLDNNLILQQSKVNQLKQLKQAYLQKLFP